MSHGGERDVILGSDNRTTRIEDLMSEFKSTNCPSLQSKPKIFIVQTCRGSLGEGLTVSLAHSINSMWISSVESDTTSFQTDSTLSRGICPLETDFLLAFATSPGYVAFRFPDVGSLYIQALVKVIKTYHKHHHLLDMMTEVTRIVVEQQKDADSQQVPAPTHTLRAQVYL